jgi:hypothetical protein
MVEKASRNQTLNEFRNGETNGTLGIIKLPNIRIPIIATNDAHYKAEKQPRTLVCVATGKNE